MEEAAMKLRTLLSGILIMLGFAVLVTVAPAARPVAASGSWSYNFESTLSPWVYGGDSCTTGSLDRTQNHNLCPVPLGAWSARLKQSPPASCSLPGVWMVASYPGDGGCDSVSLDFSAINDSNCGGCSVIAYIGNSTPTSSSQFTVVGSPISNSWQHYTLTAASSASTIYVAYGWKSNSSSPNGGGSVDFDCTNVSILLNC